MKALKRFETVAVSFFKKVRASIIKFLTELRYLIGALRKNGWRGFKKQVQQFFTMMVVSNWKLYISWGLVFTIMSLVTRTMEPLIQFTMFMVIINLIEFAMYLYFTTTLPLV